jgi:enoyl-CoA hydratase
VPDEILPSASDPNQAVAPNRSVIAPHPPYQLTSLHVLIRDRILFIELTAPDRFPRLNRWALTQLRYYMSLLARHSGLNAAIITGTEVCFAAGAELAEVTALTPPDALTFAKLGQSTMQSIESSPKPVVAAIRGYCMGGGFDLALACHRRIATPNAILAHRGASLGIITGWGGTQRLPRILGPRGHSVAMEMMFAGRRVTAAEAFNLKLISGIVPADSLLTEATKLTTGANAATNL